MSHKDASSRCIQSGAAAAMVLAGGSAWAQVCSYDLTTAATAVVGVPSLSTWGMALLVGFIGWVVWRQGRIKGARVLAILGLAGAAWVANQSGGGLIRQAYAAAVTVILSNPVGQTLTANANNGDTLTFTNTSGVPLRIASIVPAPAACGNGTLIPAGGSCSTAASCGPLVCVGANEDANNGCLCDPGYARTGGGACVAQFVCPNGTEINPNNGELICSP